MIDINIWQIVASVSALFIGLLVGFTIGRYRGFTAAIAQQQQQESQRLFTETFKRFMEVKNGRE